MNSLRNELKLIVNNGQEGRREIEFQYQIAFDLKRSLLLIRVVLNQESVVRFEKFGIHALSLQDRHSSRGNLHPSHRHFIQHLLRFSTLDSIGSYFIVPRKQASYFISRLSRLHSVRFLGSSKAVFFSKEALIPFLEWSEEGPGKVYLKLSFRKSSGGALLQSTHFFSGSRPWVLIDQVCYPVHDFEEIPFLEEFDLSGKMLLSGDHAVEFVQRHLPFLAEQNRLFFPASFHVPQIISESPKVIQTFSEDVSLDQLSLNLHFSYAGHLLPAHQYETDALEIMALKEAPLWICRDLKFEKEILDQLKTQGFQRLNSHRFDIGGERALDYVFDSPDFFSKGNAPLPALNHFRRIGSLGLQELKAQTTHTGIDWFSLDLQFELEGETFSYDLIRSLVKKGQRYLNIPGKGFIQIRSEEVQNLENQLEEIDATIDSEGKAQIKRFHAPYLEGFLRIRWNEAADLKGAVDSLRHEQGIPAHPLPTSLSEVLRPYQRQGYEWLYFLHQHRFHPILADDMGLGKTAQALAFLEDLKNQKGRKPSLILAPTSVIFNWVHEAGKFTSDLKTLLLTGPDRHRNNCQISEVDLVLVSYAIFRKDAAFLSTLSWRAIILDEAQYIKNHRSKTAMLVRTLQADQRLALTGTPLENRLSELWSIFDFLMPGFLGNYQSFRRFYQKPIEEGQSTEALDRLKKRIHPFVLRRQKQDVAPDLPSKTEIQHFCEMGSEQRKLYHEILLTSRHMVLQEVEKKGIEKSQFSILTALLRLRQVCCHPKLLGDSFKAKDFHSGKMEAFCELVSEILSEKHRIVIFSQFVEMLTLIRQWMDEQKITYEYLDGKTRKREEHIRNFQENPEISVFLISLKAGGTGLNLSQADYVIHYDPWWNPAVEDQATDRVHRLGQTQNVFAYKLITKESVEEKILYLQDRKKGLFQGVLGADSALGKKLSFEDLEYLFS